MFSFFIVSVWIYCINVLSKIFKVDSYFDYEYNKFKYLNNTVLKFDEKNIDNIYNLHFQNYMKKL